MILAVVEKELAMAEWTGRSSEKSSAAILERSICLLHYFTMKSCKVTKILVVICRQETKMQRP